MSKKGAIFFLSVLQFSAQTGAGLTGQNKGKIQVQIHFYNWLLSGHIYIYI